jgi:pantoate--beta-alanine ligase
MRLLRTREELESVHGGAFVATLGALHEGHEELIRRAATLGAPVVVSVFVNPTQFGAGEDYERYPRRLDEDARRAEAAGADAVFAPPPEVMYPPDEAVDVPPLPAVAVEPGLEDAMRPGHFAGVAQVVARLFDLVRPRTTVFGEKDYQQLLLVAALAAEHPGRWPDLEVVAHETVREVDGLARSSRNAYLSDGERERALGLFQALDAARRIARPAEAERVMRETLDRHDLATDYAVVRDARTLRPVDGASRGARGLIAARLGRVRLIDNMAMPANAPAPDVSDA